MPKSTTSRLGMAARDVCWLSRDLCHNPAWIALATAGMAAVYLMPRSFRL